jgi:hypothetical protein
VSQGSQSQGLIFSRLYPLGVSCSGIVGRQRSSPNESHQKFDLDFNKKMYPELAKFENLVFEILPTSGYDKNFTKKTWSDVKLEKNNEVYEMIFTATTEKLRLPVRPVLQGKELTEAKKEFDVAIASFNETIAEIEKNKSVLQEQKEAYQKALMGDLSALNDKLVNNTTENGTANFQVYQWGVYNCDKPSKYPSAMKNEPFFVWENSSTSADFSQIFVFNLDKDLRFNYGDRAFHPISNFGFHFGFFHRINLNYRSTFIGGNGIVTC